MIRKIQTGKKKKELIRYTDFWLNVTWCLCPDIRNPYRHAFPAQASCVICTKNALTIFSIWLGSLQCNLTMMSLLFCSSFIWIQMFSNMLPPSDLRLDIYAAIDLLDTKLLCLSSFSFMFLFLLLMILPTRPLNDPWMEVPHKQTWSLVLLSINSP